MATERRYCHLLAPRISAASRQDRFIAWSGGNITRNHERDLPVGVHDREAKHGVELEPAAVEVDPIVPEGRCEQPVEAERRGEGERPAARPQSWRRRWLKVVAISCTSELRDETMAWAISRPNAPPRSVDASGQLERVPEWQPDRVGC